MYTQILKLVARNKKKTNNEMTGMFRTRILSSQHVVYSHITSSVLSSSEQQQNASQMSECIVLCR